MQPSQTHPNSSTHSKQCSSNHIPWTIEVFLSNFCKSWLPNYDNTITIPNSINRALCCFLTLIIYGVLHHFPLLQIGFFFWQCIRANTPQKNLHLVWDSKLLNALQKILVSLAFEPDGTALLSSWLVIHRGMPLIPRASKGRNKESTT